MTDFYYDKVIQPGQVGFVRITLRKADNLGPADAVYKLYTNDSKHPAVEFKITAVIKAIPDSMKRIANAKRASGETIGNYNIFPTMRPDATVERGEHLKLSLKIRPLNAEDGELKIAAKVDQAACTLKRIEPGDYYLLDIEPEPIGASGVRTITVPLQSTGPRQDRLAIQVTLHVPADNIVYTPNMVDCGVIPLSALKESPLLVGRVGVRKMVGNFKITSATSSLAFLKPEVQTMVDGSNYLIRLGTIPANLPKAGNYEGVIRVETDDPDHAKIEIPVKIALTN